MESQDELLNSNKNVKKQKEKNLPAKVSRPTERLLQSTVNSIDVKIIPDLEYVK